METDMERLLILFRRTRALPELPGTALRLARMIDCEATSFGEVERIICTDPGLSVRILRASNSVKYAGNEPVATVRAAVMRLGIKSVKALALSFVIQDVVKSGTGLLDMNRFIYHAVFVGLLARYTFARRQTLSPFPSKWTGDEIFAAGVLHDLQVPLLAHVSPDTARRTFAYAMKAQTTIEQAFGRLYKGSIADLGAAAVITWQLPELFSQAIVGMRNPWNQEEYAALSCLAYAEYLAESHGATTEEWPVHPELAPDILLDTELPAEEVAELLLILSAHTHTYLEEAHVAAA